MEKTLSIIQKMAKIGKIVSRVAMVASIAGAALSLLGIICVATTGITSIQINGMTIQELIADYMGMGIYDIYVTMANAMIILAGEAVVAWFAGQYCTQEMEDGTPFTLDGASCMLRFGIIAAAVSVGTQTVSAIVCLILEGCLDFTTKAHAISTDITVIAGVLFIAMSFILRYGAELNAKREEADSE